MANLTASLYDVFVEVWISRKSTGEAKGKPVLQRFAIVAHTSEQASQAALTLARSRAYWNRHYPNLAEDHQIQSGEVRWCTPDEGPRVDGIHEAVLKP